MGMLSSRYRTRLFQKRIPLTAERASPKIPDSMKLASQQLRPAVPRQFFMSLRDLSFWFYSARADSLLKRMRREQGDQEAFEALYQSLRDPWSTTVPYYRYQLRKYQVMLSFLPARSYDRALDIGCGLGVLTRMLSGLAGEALGVDFSRQAVDRAAELSAGTQNVRFKQADLLTIGELSEGLFDLIVLADTPIREQLTGLLAPGGILLLVNHFYFRFDALSRVSRRIHDCFSSSAELRPHGEYRRPFYLVSVLERRGNEK